MRISPTLALFAALAVALPAALATPALAQPAGCPPGLAKKSPACIPPGQAKKMDVTRTNRDDDESGRHYYDDDGRGRYYIDEDGRLWRYSAERDDYFIDEEGYIWRTSDGRVYRRGDRLENVDYVYLSPTQLARLPLLQDGRNYVRVDNQVLEVIEAGNLFVRTLGAFDTLLN